MTTDPLAPQASQAKLEAYKGGEDRNYPAPPPGFDNWEEPSGLPPVAVFDAPGDFVAGHFRGTQDEVGPNKSRMYYLALHPSRELIGVWGSTALDKHMDLAGPNIGDAILIQFLGVEETKRAQNPVKVFRVRIKRKS